MPLQIFSPLKIPSKLLGVRNMLSEKILKAQHGNQNCMLDLIRCFQELLQKYAYELRYEDAFNDLRIALIELIYKIKVEDFVEKGDGALVNYISRSINHTYLKLSKKKNFLHSREQRVSDLNETQQFYIENSAAPEEEYLSKFKSMLSGSHLTKSEEDVIIKLFFWGFSVSETAKEMRISRQSVNQTKNRAIKKLRKTYLP